MPPVQEEGRDGPDVEPRPSSEPGAEAAATGPPGQQSDCGSKDPDEDAGFRAMDLLSLTQNRFVWVGLEAQRKESAIEQLLDCLLAAGAVPGDAREELLDEIMARVEREVAALGVFPAGVHFEAVDNSITRIVILLITPVRKRHRHVTNLAAIARQLLRPEVRGALLTATSPSEAVEAMRRQGA